MPLAAGRTIALVPKTLFDPQVHGFAFVNSFQLAADERAKLAAALGTAIDLVLAPLGPLGPLGFVVRTSGLRDKFAQSLAANIPDGYGLCGGMAFAALDYFNAGMPTPRGNGPYDQPPPGSGLRSYLSRRLVESWVPNGVTFLEWIARLHYLPRLWFVDAGPRALRDRSREAWRTLKQQLDAGVPVPIGLVGDATNPFMDHQVVAYDYDATSEFVGTIYVYDMNYPGVGQTIKLDLSSDTVQAEESCRSVHPLTGFFCEKYEPATPPA